MKYGSLEAYEYYNKCIKQYIEDNSTKCPICGAIITSNRCDCEYAELILDQDMLLGTNKN